MYNKECCDVVYCMYLSFVLTWTDVIFAAYFRLLVCTTLFYELVLSFNKVCTVQQLMKSPSPSPALRLAWTCGSLKHFISAPLAICAPLKGSPLFVYKEGGSRGGLHFLNPVSRPLLSHCTSRPPGTSPRHHLPSLPPSF